MTAREKFLELVKMGVALRAAGSTSHRLAVLALSRALHLPEWAPHPADLAEAGPDAESALALAALDFVGWCWNDNAMPAWMGRVLAHLKM